MKDCSESEGEGGTRPTRRAHSVAPVGRSLLSMDSSSLSISTSDLSGGGRPARAAPTLCPQHRPPHVCQSPCCDKLHVCRLYVDGFCSHGDAVCRWGHSVASDNNQAALAAHQLQGLSERELLWMVGALMRKTAPVTAEEYRSQLAVCPDYATDARCGRSSAATSSGVPQADSSLSPASIAGSPAAVTPAADIGGGLPEKEMEAQTATATAGTLPERDGGTGDWHGSAVEHESGFGLDGSGGGEAGDFLEPEQHTEKCGGVKHPDQGAGNSDGAGQNLQSTTTCRQSVDESASEQQPQPTPPSNSGTDKHPVHGQGIASKSAPKQQPRDKRAPNTTTAKIWPKKITKKGMMDIARKLDVCRRYFYPSKCTNKKCDKLHLCRFFIACRCTYAIFQCWRSHYLWTDPHNARVLRAHKLNSLTESDVFRALRDGYLAQNPVTDLERRFLVQMCRPHQRGFCHRSECTRLHICDRYISGTCGSTCRLSHDLKSQHNAAVLSGLGLDTLTVEEIWDLLENPITARAMWESSAEQAVTAEDDDQSAAMADFCDGRPPSSAFASGGTAAQLFDTGGDTSEEYLNMTAAAADGSKPSEPAVVDEATSTGSENEESDDGSIDLLDDSPVLCAHHSCGRRCQRSNCDGFHICGFYLANLCRRQDGACPFGHSFGEAHNVRMMDAYGLLGGSPEHFQELLDQMTIRARISFSNGAEEKVAMCIAYNSTAGCTSEECCGRFHLCNRFLAGTCNNTDCERHHSMDDEHNLRVRDLLGLAAKPGGRHRHAWATDRDIVELIRAKLGVKPGVYLSPEPATEEAEGCVSEDITEEKSKAVSNGTTSLPSVDERAPDVPPTRHTSASGRSRVPPLPPVCGSLITGRSCSDAKCSAVHICPHFLAGACRRQHCTLGHRLDSVPNRRPLRLAGRFDATENHKSLVKELYAASANVRRAEVYMKLRICISHNHVGGCKLIGCPYVHICQRFVSGTCTEIACVKGHYLETEGNKRKLRSLKLETAPVGEILEMLRAIHGIRSVC